jgi:hypothetical protein
VDRPRQCLLKFPLSGGGKIKLWRRVRRLWIRDAWHQLRELPEVRDIALFERALDAGIYPQQRQAGGSSRVLDGPCCAGLPVGTVVTDLIQRKRQVFKIIS